MIANILRVLRPSNGNRFSAGAQDTPVLAMLFGIVIAFALYHDITRPYTTTPDADLVYVYQALLINDGLRQAYHDHTGYTYFLILASWTKILAWLGVIPVSRLSQLPGPDSFEPAIAKLVYAGRWLSVVLSTVFVWRVCRGLRLLTGNNTLALTLAVLLAASPGLIRQALLLRDELPAMLFCWEAFVCLVLATRTGGWRALLWLALSAFFALLSFESKIQVVPLLLALPLLAAMFRQPPPAGPLTGDPGRISIEEMLFIVMALALSVPAATMIAGQIDFAGGSGGYQAAIVGYVILSVWIYGWYFDIPWRRRLLALAAVLMGAALGQLVHLITNDPINTKVLANFIEHMARFTELSISTNVDSPGTFANSIATKLAESVQHTFDRNFLSSAVGPAFSHQLLYWSVCLGIVASIASRRWIIALRCGLLLMIAFGMEVFCGLRGFPLRYYIFVGPWLWLALGLILADVFRRYPVPTVAGFIRSAWAPQGAAVAILAIIFAVNIEKSLGERMVFKQPPSNVCGQARAYLHRLPGYFDKYCD
jgi:hypothetical protein